MDFVKPTMASKEEELFYFCNDCGKRETGLDTRFLKSVFFVRACYAAIAVLLGVKTNTLPCETVKKRL